MLCFLKIYEYAVQLFVSMKNIVINDIIILDMFTIINNKYVF